MCGPKLREKLLSTNDKIDLLEAVNDFASAVREYGPMRVAQDMRKYFPERHGEYIAASLNLERQRQVAALFKPREV